MRTALFSFLAIAIVTTGALLWLRGEPQSPAESAAGVLPPLEPPPPIATEEATKNRMHRVSIETNFGSIEFETYDADAPRTVENFISLAAKGFYNGLTFHRVVPGFVIQGGDPNGDGSGGPGYTFPDELNPSTESYRRGYVKGVVAMANAGPNTNGSQFFVMLADVPLPRNYTIFGNVTLGQDVLDAIGRVALGPNDRPVEAVRMTAVYVEELR